MMDPHMRDEENEDLIQDMIRDGTEGYFNYSGEGVEGVGQLAAPVRMEQLAALVREHLMAPMRTVKLTAPVMEP